MCQKWLKCKTLSSDRQALANLSLMLLPSAALLLCGRLLLPCGVSKRNRVPALQQLQQTLVKRLVFFGCCHCQQKIELPSLVCELEQRRQGHVVSFASSAMGVVALGRGMVKKRVVRNCTAICSMMMSEPSAILI